MPLWAIVPVKPFLRSKSRLAGVLSPEARAGLSREFLGHTLQVLAQVPEVSRLLVVSRDPAALALARDLKAHTVTEAGAPDLNRALTRAAHVAAAEQAGAVLILPADLPFMTVADVQALVNAAGPGPALVLAPDRHETGTNALYLRPPGLFSFAFGESSFAVHLALGQGSGAAVHICRRPGLALDVDGPEDLALYRAAQGGELGAPTAP
jgi:2-phospho-L-lactate/phosphoenolpyruvate guanylyltransferase